MVHSIYSNKDSFLRELISNASDALDKLRLESLVDKDLDVDTSDLHIKLVPDAEKRTLTVIDNGIGMSRDEVIELDRHPRPGRAPRSWPLVRSPRRARRACRRPPPRS